MKLYEVPRNTKVRLLENADLPPEHRGLAQQEVVLFHHVDGMYSYCTNAEGFIVHPAAWTEVEIVSDENST